MSFRDGNARRAQFFMRARVVAQVHLRGRTRLIGGTGTLHRGHHVVAALRAEVPSPSQYQAHDPTIQLLMNPPAREAMRSCAFATPSRLLHHVDFPLQRQ
eukprot:TRINITY_DN1217_c0_g1_i1.p1 TRINITY_DN1217_c0_g1~~TRINITY_DN1217_c0_g1_i1.p1  ORF type:complete len:100 (+),score=4.13 TRINITY_DN1217_c0_g1_i1:231-530(+)